MISKYFSAPIHGEYYKNKLIFRANKIQHSHCQELDNWILFIQIYFFTDLNND